MIINKKEISPNTTPLTFGVLVEMTRFTVINEIMSPRKSVANESFLEI